MNRVVLLFIPLLLESCGSPTEPPASQSDREPDANVIGEPLERSLAKARTVEGLSGQRKDRLDEAVDPPN